MGYAPTPEQAAIIAAARVERDLIIEAGAGTGKTSTLRFLANDQPKDRCLYIAYNKAMQVAAEASFPANVKCRTAHSLAYAGTIGKYGNRVSKARMGSLPSWELRDQLKINKVFKVSDDEDAKPLGPKTLAEMVARTLTRFTTTGDREVTTWHVPRVPGLDDADRAAELAVLIVDYARRAWTDYANPKGTLTFNPNIYLKLWQLSNPTLRFDTIFFDEAQDANGAMAAVVNRQTCKRRAVGDRNQALYEWNGAVDAMAKWDWPRLYLTQSFRFGPAVAVEANKWLNYLDADLRLSGLESIGSEIVDELPDPSAILCRRNLGVIEAALGKLAQGYRVCIPGGIGEAAELAKAAGDLRAYGSTTHPDLAAFDSWEAFTTFVRTDADGEDFRTLVSLVETYGTDQILALKHSLTENEDDADVVVTTGHKAKGKEWHSVLIGADFAPRESDPEAGDEPLFTRTQAMLAYVAITRGKFQVCPGPLAGVV